MSDTRNSFESHGVSPIEKGLRELTSAERAGVFRRTPVEATALLASGDADTGRPMWARWLPRVIPAAAAAVALAVGLGSWMFTLELRSIRERQSALLSAKPAAAAVDPSAFARCFSGPAASVSMACRDNDFDADGDVDMADFGAFQLTFERSRSGS